MTVVGEEWDHLNTRWILARTELGRESEHKKRRTVGEEPEKGGVRFAPLSFPVSFLPLLWLQI